MPVPLWAGLTGPMSVLAMSETRTAARAAGVGIAKALPPTKT